MKIEKKNNKGIHKLVFDAKEVGVSLRKVNELRWGGGVEEKNKLGRRRLPFVVFFRVLFLSPELLLFTRTHTHSPTRARAHTHTHTHSDNTDADPKNSISLISM